MPVIELSTQIAAPIHIVFDLARSIDLHVQTAARTRERAVAGRTTGRISLGETVRWRGIHFGLPLWHESQITQFDAPVHFRDVMIRGLFSHFIHDHYFREIPQGGTVVTQMIDRLDYQAPLGPLGRIAEWAVLHRHLMAFLSERNDALRRVAENPAARQAFLS